MRGSRPGSTPRSLPGHRDVTVRQLRVVVTADDYDDALRFYRDVLGLPRSALSAASTAA